MAFAAAGGRCWGTQLDVSKDAAARRYCHRRVYFRHCFPRRRQVTKYIFSTGEFSFVYVNISLGHRSWRTRVSERGKASFHFFHPEIAQRALKGENMRQLERRPNVKLTQRHTTLSILNLCSKFNAKFQLYIIWNCNK